MDSNWNLTLWMYVKDFPFLLVHVRCDPWKCTDFLQTFWHNVFTCLSNLSSSITAIPSNLTDLVTLIIFFPILFQHILFDCVRSWGRRCVSLGIGQGNYSLQWLGKTLCSIKKNKVSVFCNYVLKPTFIKYARKSIEFTKIIAKLMQNVLLNVQY